MEGQEHLQETSEHVLQRPCDERGGSQQNPELHGKDNSAGDSGRSKKERNTEETGR